MPDPMPSQGAPVTIPLWEWRALAPVLACGHALVADGDRLNQSVSREITLLCLTSSHDVRIREGSLSFKWRKQAGQDGMELWDSVLKCTFPCPRETVLRLFDIWGITCPDLNRSTYSLEAFLENLIQEHPDLQVVTVDKQAETFSLQGARCEWAQLTANDIRLESLCIEHEDPSLALQVIQRLGLQAHDHISYPQGLKRALNLTPPH